MMLRTCKIGSAKNLTSTRISKGSEGPVQVFNKYFSLDGSMTCIQREFSLLQHLKGKQIINLFNLIMESKNINNDPILMNCNYTV